MARLKEANNNEVLSFLARLYAAAEDGALELRALDLSRKRRSVSRWFPHETARYEDAIDFAKSFNDDGFDLFFMPNPVVPGGQRDEDVLCGVTLFADIDALRDQSEAEARLEKELEFLPVPIDAAVFTGGGLHLYSFLDEPTDQADALWTSYLKGVRAYALQRGGDPVSINASRVLRWPGSYSWKRSCRTLLWMA